MQVVIRLADVCNLKCRMCCFYSSENANKKQMSLEKLMIILEKLKHTRYIGRKIDEIRLDGNREGLCYPHIAQAIKMCKEHGFTTSLTTNATLLNRATSERVLTAGLDSINFSVSGITAKTYSRFQGYLMPENQYSTVCKNVIDFITTRNNLSSSCRTTISLLLDEIMLKNADEYREALFFWHKKGIDNIQYISEYEHNKKWGKKGTSFCANTPIIREDGTVIPCCGGSEEIVLGNLLNDEPNKIFNGESAAYLHKALSSCYYENLPKGCESCVFYGMPERHIMKYFYGGNYITMPANSRFDFFFMKSLNKKVIIFGISADTYDAIDICKKNSIVIEYIFDNNFRLWGSTLNNILVVGIEELYNKHLADYVLLTCTHDISDAISYGFELGFKYIFSYALFFEQIAEKYPIITQSFNIANKEAERTSI